MDVSEGCELTKPGGMPSLQSIVGTLLWQLTWACWLWFSSPGMMWKTRLENGYCILELVVSILLNLMCAWTSGAECQDLTKVEGPTSKEQISQYRSSEGREALGLVGAQSNIWGLYSNTLPCDIALSPTPQSLQEQQWEMPLSPMHSSLSLCVWPTNTDLEAFGLIHVL